VNTQTQMHMPVAAMATARVFECSNAFAPHAWSPKAIKARTAYGIRRLGKSST
jgi:hypothetical protein